MIHDYRYQEVARLFSGVLKHSGIKPRFSAYPFVSQEAKKVGGREILSDSTSHRPVHWHLPDGGVVRYVGPVLVNQWSPLVETVLNRAAARRIVAEVTYVTVTEERARQLAALSSLDMNRRELNKLALEHGLQGPPVILAGLVETNEIAYGAVEEVLAERRRATIAA
ncbi:hypothetical protein HYS84_00345 [Candidatus Saccharibacteria bacterium]|nr:hypothetical protein [Candidatus Saccharibacteria bacterium]